MTPERVAEAQQLQASGATLETISHHFGLHKSTISRAMKAHAKACPPARSTSVKHVTPVHAKPPRETETVYSWSLEQIRAARNEQLRGHFKLPVKLAEASRTDDAIFVARNTRVSTQSAIDARIIPRSGQLGKRAAARLARGVTTARSVLVGIQGTLADHGVAIGYNERTVSEDGTMVHLTLKEWPLEHVWWHVTERAFVTRTNCGETVRINHGDGFWVVFTKFDKKPWTQDACILPIGTVWGAHANGLKDWAGSSKSHGLPRVVGELPEGFSLEGRDGELTPEGNAFLEMMLDVVSGEAGAGIRPAGSSVDFVANSSAAWQVFKELVDSREKAAARIYLGTDAILGAQGGAPGVDISALFGVASTKLQGDFQTIEDAVKTGVYEPWSDQNYGDATLAPSLEYQIPDPDSERKSEEAERKIARLWKDIEQRRARGFEVTQEVVNEQARTYGVHPAPKLAATESRSVQLDLAPTDVAKVVKVQEARASRGLPPLGDERDQSTLSELGRKPTVTPASETDLPSSPGSSELLTD